VIRREGGKLVNVRPDDPISVGEAFHIEGVSSVEAARPFLRWAGGKTRLLSRLLPFVPPRFNNYHEPFLGAGALFFATRARKAGTAYLGDLNEELINIWLIVRDKPNQLFNELNKYYGLNSGADYYRVRSERPTTSVKRAARFFYLNQTSWNGLWRVNRWGVYNVPWGARPFKGISTKELIAASAAFKSTHIECVDFRANLDRPKRGDFVYLDPPYLPISDTSKFSGYTETRFRVKDLQELAQVCDHLSRRGIYWVLSNRDTSKVRELFSFANINALTARRSVAAQNRRDIEPVNSPEVIITGRQSR
jgi:DNA adenine methylase